MRAVLRLPFIHEYKDHHGRVRRYFRQRGLPRVPLPGSPGSPDFMTAYNAAVAALNVREIGKTRSAPGTVSAAIAAYRDNRFTALAPGTQRLRRSILERFRADHGDKRLAGLQKQHVAAILGAKKPFAARNWLTTLRGLMQFAVATGLIGSDPTTAFEPAKTGRAHPYVDRDRNRAIRSAAPDRIAGQIGNGANALHWTAPQRRPAYGTATYP